MEETKEDSCNSSTSCPDSSVSHGPGVQPQPHRWLLVYFPQWSPMAQHNGHSNANDGSSHYSFSSSLPTASPIRTDWTWGSSTDILTSGFYAEITPQHVHPTTGHPTSPTDLSTTVWRSQGDAHFVFAFSTRYPMQHSQWRRVVAWF